MPWELVGTIPGGRTNAVINVKPAVRLTTHAEWRTEVRSSLAVTLLGTDARIGVDPALVVAASSVGAIAPVAHTPGVALSTRIAAPTIAQAPAFDLVRATYDLTHLSGSNAATNTGAHAWTNPANAQGVNNGTMATAAGDLTASRNYVLTLNYADFRSKDDLVITAARLRFYARQDGTSLNNGNLIYKWSTASTGTVTALTIAANADHTVTPYVVDLFAAGVTTWADLDTLAASVSLVLPSATNLVNASVDAVTLEVIASRTDNL